MPSTEGLAGAFDRRLKKICRGTRNALIGCIVPGIPFFNGRLKPQLLLRCATVNGRFRIMKSSGEYDIPVEVRGCLRLKRTPFLRQHIAKPPIHYTTLTTLTIS